MQKLLHFSKPLLQLILLLYAGYSAAKTTLEKQSLVRAGGAESAQLQISC